MPRWVKDCTGFTLIELMIAVAVAAILAAVAYPSYMDYVYKSRRADAVNTLLKLQLDQEKYRAGNPSYTSTLLAGGLGWTTSTSPDGYYTLSIDADADASSFQARAVPRVGSAQTGDSCAVIAINQSGPVTGAPTTHPRCWNR